MKDMSEEKEYHKHKFVVKDGDKAFPIMMCEECEFELDKEYYDGYVSPLELELKEWKVKCAFLESRLKEAQEERNGYKGQLEQHEKCTDAFTEEMKIRHEAEIKVNYDKHKQIQSLEQRLSQAEAELAELKRFTHCAYCEAEFPLDSVTAEQVGEHIHNCPKHPIAVYKTRLSHLMDVAGKMAGAIEEIVKQTSLPTQAPEYDDETGSHWVEIAYALALNAGKALAEWDGIKDGGK